VNHLAHVFLAAPHAGHVVGALLGDFVKGRIRAGSFPPAVATGIWLHRRIDSYTDAHAVVRRSRGRFSRERRRYAGLIVDVVYDHFLALAWQDYSVIAFPRFTREAYRTLWGGRELFPPPARAVLGRMIERDWLGAYRHLDGLERVLGGLAARLRRPNPVASSLTEVERHARGLREDFDVFFPDLVGFVAGMKRDAMQAGGVDFCSSGQSTRR
jgi:acyl carrier protein phosphodiesterase